MPQRHDLYLAETHLPDGRIVLKARVIVEPDGQARVWEARPGEGGMVARLAWEGQVMLTVVPEGPHAPQSRRRLEADVHGGGRLLVTNVGGCECGGVYVLRRIPGVDFDVVE